MSRLPAIQKNHAAKKQQLDAAFVDARSRLWAHERTSEENALELANVEAAFVANATSEALGEEPTQKVPDAYELEKLRAAVAVAPAVRRQLEANVEACEKASKAAEATYNGHVAQHLRETAVKPALVAMEDAFDGLREAAVNLMAAHYLAYRKFDDKAPLPNTILDLHGPAAELLAFLQAKMPWPNWPYEIRPSWLPSHGGFFPDELPGVAVRVAELLGEIEAYDRPGSGR